MQAPSEGAPGAPAGEERILRLERSVRQLRAALAAVVVAGAALAVASLSSRDTLRLRELSVVDANGRVRIALSAAKENVALEHYDADGRMRISEGVDADGKA